MCANGFQFPDQYCPDGLMFNGEVCDWPENVECGCNDGIYPVEDECASYYVCHEGVQYPNQYCPDGLFFNEHQLVCDWPENVECGNSENDQVLIKIIKNHIQLKFRYTGTVLKDVRKIHQPGFFGHAMQNVVKLFQ